ncbi:MAG: acyl-ACP--UDP-N-acetylglucosamine O-acyltransferase [Planctomycetes bacterium]|nr:acyl-ACP--UDP-N-acetylglucosamine O-acyltransferase [Planctomycetota bacterium]
MSNVHPTAILTGDVKLANGVEIGPYCVLDGTIGPISLGAGTRLMHMVSMQGPLTVGERNRFYPGSTIGYPPQDLSFDPDKAGSGCIIGNENTFRESVSIHRAKTERPTQIGDKNYWMANSHAGHDCVVGNRCIFANTVSLGGHVEVGDGVIFGGSGTAHQFVRIGRGAFIGGLTGLSTDLPPFFMLTGINVAGSLNLVGMRRSGMKRTDIDTVRWVFDVVQKSKLSRPNMLALLAERKGDPLVEEYIRFIEAAKRPITPNTGSVMRGASSIVPT